MKDPVASTQPTVLGWIPSLPAIWRVIVVLSDTLSPARVSLVIAATLPALFLLVDQGFDILCALGDPGKEGVWWGRIAWFYAGITFFGLMNWYGPRFLLNCDFGASPNAANIKRRLTERPGSLKTLGSIENGLRLHVPRMLGTVPIVLIGGGFFRAAYLNAHADRPQGTIHYELAIGCLIAAALLYSGFILRRFFLNRWLLGDNPEYKTLRNVVNNRPALIGLVLFSLPAVFLGVAFSIEPVVIGQEMGSGAVLLFALASWSCYGGLAVYFGNRYKLPALGILGLLVFISSFSNDNHEVRSLPAREPARESLVDNLKSWHALVVKRYPGEPQHPMFIVATEGGGIRAGYWTALVLSTLEDAAAIPGSFADHLFAISGVSGGSLGAATFDVLLAEAAPGGLTRKIRPILGQEFLGPLAGKMFLPDLAQRFIPVPIDVLDRARALEGGWERADDRFGMPFTALFEGAHHLPALFLNGTEVESGDRIITSSLDYAICSKGEFIGALDGVTMMEGMRMRLSTAVHASARFTYFSPAGRYPGGTHVVDGGYFDNSGCETARDILKVVEKQHWADVKPVILVIQNGPEKVPLSVAEQKKAAAKLRSQHSAHEVFAPVLTMLNVRTAHSDQSRGELEEGHPSVPTFNLVVRGTALPLGWTLSPGAIEEMEFQVDPRSEENEKTWEACDDSLRAQLKNSEVKKSIIALLPKTL